MTNVSACPNLKHFQIRCGTGDVTLIRKIENIVRKCWLPTFSPFLTSFQRMSYSKSLESGKG